MYKIKEMDGKYAVMDSNNEIAGLFGKKALATKVAADMNKSVEKPKKNKKKAKKKQEK